MKDLIIQFLNLPVTTKLLEFLDAIGGVYILALLAIAVLVRYGLELIYKIAFVQGFFENIVDEIEASKEETRTKIRIFVLTIAVLLLSLVVLLLILFLALRKIDIMTM